jgi:hypothetical protein
MENSKLHIPTLRELKQVCTNEKYDNVPSDKLLWAGIRILKENYKFHQFLENIDFEDYELPYAIFSQIIDFIKYCYDKKDIDNIENIFLYLENMLKSKDDNILDLVCIWALESFYIHKKVLPKILKLMPINLKTAFLTDFSDYLK